jgi:hypothetical protein
VRNNNKKDETKKKTLSDENILTREGFLRILRKVTRPVPKPPDEEKSKTSE